MRRWCKKRNPSIFATDTFIVPTRSGMHWCCGVVDFEANPIQIRDPLGVGGDRFFPLTRGSGDTLRRSPRTDAKTPFDLAGWMDVAEHEGPTQLNGFDCGTFVCPFIINLCKGAEVTFTQLKDTCRRGVQLRGPKCPHLSKLVALHV